jgi:5'(3')-deoxyribonucleotidase
MKKKIKYEIFCDMDGVLVNFEDAAVDSINEALRKKNPPLNKIAKRIKNTLKRDFVMLSDLERNSPTQCNHVTEYMYKLLEDDEEFWLNLEWMPRGKELWDSIRDSKPYILTTPMEKVGSMSGKLKWVEKNIGLENVKGVILSCDKKKYAQDKNSKKINVLIDDFVQNIKPWIKEGGVGLQYNHNDIDKILEKLNQVKRLVKQH